MGVILDLIASSFVGGLLMLMILSATDRGVDQFFSSNADAIVQANLSQISAIVNHDIRKMGYGVPEAQIPTVMRAATANKLRFLANLNANSETSLPSVGFYDLIADTIEYEILLDEIIPIGDTMVVMFNVNRLVSVVGGPSSTMSIGRLSANNVFVYRDQAGDTTSTLSEIRMVEVSLVTVHPHVVLSPEAVMTGLSDADKEIQMREIRRLLRPAYSRQNRMVSRNMRR